MAGKNGQSNSRPDQRPSRSYLGSVGVSGAFSTHAGQEWEMVPMSLVQGAVVAVTTAAGGLLLGATRDGTCIGITLFYEDERVRFYPRTAEECQQLLEDLISWAQRENRQLHEWARTG